MKIKKLEYDIEENFFFFFVPQTIEEIQAEKEKNILNI